MSGPVEIGNVAQETYNLALITRNSHEQALEAAVNAGIKAAEQDIIDRVALTIGEYIIDLELDAELVSDPDRYDHYRSALQWLMEKLLEDLPAASTQHVYAPADGDFIQAVITGEVNIDIQECGNCGKSNHLWWCLTNDQGEKFEFTMESDVQVRKIATAVRPTS